MRLSKQWICRRVFSYATLMPLCVFPAWARGSATAFDSAAFERLAPEKRFQVVLAALDWRERQLSNFSYTATEDSTYDGRFVSHSTYDFQRAGMISLLHCTRFAAPRGSPPIEFWIRWDGNEETSLTKKKGEYSALRNDRESVYVRMLTINEMLGFRTEFFPMTVVDWIRSAVEKGKCRYQTGIQRTAKAGILVYIELPLSARFHLRYTLDPRRDFMIVGRRWTSAAGPAKDYARGANEVTAASHATGLWVPTQSRRTANPSAGPRTQSVTTYRITSFALNKVAVQDLGIKFPVGTRVMDNIKKTYYIVEKGNHISPGPYYDAGTGQVLGPSGSAAKRSPTTAPVTQPSSRQ